MTDTIHIYTIQMGKWRKAEELKIPLLDITAKSGNPNFAPLFENVMKYKRGEMTEEEYTEAYYAKMRQSLREHPTEWEILSKVPVVALVCYCAAGKYCHRHLFADMMIKYLKKKGLDAVLEGEIL